MPAWSGSGEDALPGLQAAAFSLCCHTAFPGYMHVWKELSGVSSSWVTRSTRLELYPYDDIPFVVVVQLPSHARLCDPVDYSTPGLPGSHHLLEFAQVHVH